MTRHARHYTHEEATAALPWVREQLGRIRAAREGLNDEEARAALADARPTNGGGAPGRVVSEAFVTLQRALQQLTAAEIVVRDLERGLIDFPSLRDGEEVYLCWIEQEEEAIAFWHPLDTGIAGRRPL